MSDKDKNTSCLLMLLDVRVLKIWGFAKCVDGKKQDTQHGKYIFTRPQQMESAWI